MKLFTFVVVATLLASFALGATPNPGHDASSVGAGTFSAGDYVFPAKLTANGDLVVDTTTLYVGSSNNRVGIGTAAPGYTLDVNGTLAVSGATAFSSTVTISGNTVWHAGNDGSGSGLSADNLDGIDSTAFASRESNSAAVTAGNWYRIASISGGNRADAIFTLHDQISGGGHSTLRFIVGSNYNNAAGLSVTVLSHSIYSTPTFTQIRVLQNTTYDAQYVEVYVARTGNVDYTIFDNEQTSGWTAEDWTAGSIPTGYTEHTYDVNELFVVANTGDADSFRVDRDGNVGIGTAAPAYKLDVNGTGYFTGALTAANGFTLSSGTLTLPSNSIASAMIASSAINSSKLQTSNSPSNGYVLAYNSSSGGFYWVSSTAGAVTQINTGNGLTGGPITSTGTISINATTCAASQYTYWNGTAWLCGADDDNPDSDAEVPDAITVSGGTIGSNTISSGTTFTTAGTFTIGDNGDNVIVNAANWDVDSSGNIQLPTNKYLAMLTSGASGNGGYFEGTGEAGTNAGYGAWVNYNAYWNGSSWVQPRGSLGSYLTTSNYHLGWSWRYAAANGSNGAVIVPVEVASIDNTGTMQLSGSLTATGVTSTSGLTVNSGSVSLPSGQIDSTEIADNTIAEADLLASNTPSNGQVLAYNSSSGGFYWTSPAAGTVTGSGTATQIAYWSGASALTGSANLYWDNGNTRLGIGTNSPTQALDVRGSANISSNIYYGGNLTGAGADFAERLSMAEPVQAGDVVCLTANNKIEKCTLRGQRTVAGVVSTKPTIIGNGNAENSAPVGIVGIVPTKVVGPVQRGELLTTSTRDGYAETATQRDFGAIIGKAMEPCSDKTCVIDVLVGLR